MGNAASMPGMGSAALRLGSGGRPTKGGENGKGSVEPSPPPMALLLLLLLRGVVAVAPVAFAVGGGW